MMESDVLIDEILRQVSQVPIECQEEILFILRSMKITKKCLTKEFEYLSEFNLNAK